jgi:CheY-like chemotaxis protein
MPKSAPVILVVEDEPIIRMGAVDFVIAAGFEALEASSADEAIWILEGRPDIHLVFTDIGLAGTMDGIKLANYVRDRWPPIHLVVVSGNLVVDQSLLPVGAKFFPKPYRNSAIVEALLGTLPPPSQTMPTAA